MLFNIIYIELKKNLKSPAFYIFSAILFLCALLFTFTFNPNNVFMGISHGKEYYNSPILIAQMASRLSVLGLLFTMILVGRSVAKDFESGIHEIVFSYPVSKIKYLGGRFLGSFIANILVFFGLFIGFEVGFFGLNLIKPDLCGPFRIDSYFLPLLLVVIPNVFFVGSIFFNLATLSRKMFSTYIAGIAFLGIYGIAIAGFRFIDSDAVKTLIDPFGINGLNVLTKFWTVADMNQNGMPISILFIINRLIWVGVGVLILIRTFSKFRFVAALESKNEKKVDLSDNSPEIIDIPKPEFSLSFKPWFYLRQCLSISFVEFKRIIIHPAFIILTLLALLQIVSNFVGDLGMNSSFPDAIVYPFSSWYLKQTVHLWMYMLPIVILFGGMLVWKEKDAKSDELYNSLPLPNWFYYFTKFLTLLNIQIFYLLLAIVTGVVTQTVFLNFYNIELGLYFKQLFGIDLINYVHLIIVVLLIQTLSPNKYLGFFLSSLYFAIDLIVFGSLGYENLLLRYGNVPQFTYSNLNGFGHYSTTIIWYTLYWAIFGAILILMTIHLWRRSVENNLKYRFKSLKKNLSKKQLGVLLGLLFLFVSTGSYIAFNRYILNFYLSRDDYKRMQADYEVKYQRFAGRIQPTITHVDLKVDIYPEDRSVIIKGAYQLQNKTDSLIHQVFVNLNDWNFSGTPVLEFDRESNLLLHGKEFGFRVYQMKNSIKPGEKVNLKFEYQIVINGFTDRSFQDDIAENGTCLVLSGFSSSYFPVVGYNLNNEIISDNDRKDFKLQPKPDLPKLEKADRTKGLVNLSRVTYNAVISTSFDQVAISNGSLEKKWEENGRKYFHYKSDVSMMNELAIVSGRYEIRSVNHKGVNIEVYYDKNHGFNIDRIISGLEDSYDYCTQYFSEYPYKDLRVVEIPDYMKEGGARHFPTLFIWRETAGFITNYENGQEVDVVYGIAAHENAHHWWAGIVTPAYAEGAYMLTESLCQYVWSMTFEKKYGIKLSRKYLKSEMQAYERRRQKDLEGEKPLYKSSFQQSYIGYQKSSTAMYTLQNYIGEDSVAKALKRIVKKYNSRIDSFPLASDLLTEYYRVTPDSLRYLIDDLFTKITFYENKILSASCKKISDNQYQVDLVVKSMKYYSDSIGNQKEVQLHDYIYIGLTDENGDEIYYKKHLFCETQKSIKINTIKKPSKAGIDPFCLLIDRDVDNNVMPISEN